MDINAPSPINALNGTTVRISCIFISCYKIDLTQFNMNWTYQETSNHSEEKVNQLFYAFLNIFSSEPLKLTMICLSLCSLWHTRGRKEWCLCVLSNLEKEWCFLETWIKMTCRSHYQMYSSRTKGFTTVMWKIHPTESEDMASSSSMLLPNVRHYPYLLNNALLCLKKMNFVFLTA